MTERGTVGITAGNLTAVDPEVTAGTRSNTQLVYRLEALPVYGTLTLNGELLGVGMVVGVEHVDDKQRGLTHGAIDIHAAAP